jgi:hypothetical protein
VRIAAVRDIMEVTLMRTRAAVLAATMLVLSASPGLAQNFKGRGTDATQRFALTEGVAVFEVEHKGDGDFNIRLLDDQGQVIGEVARGTGDFGGAKALRIPRTSYYIYDVEATGEWSVRLREIRPDNGPPDPAAERGAEAGRVDGGRPGTTGWLARGLLGGALLGPIGTAIAVNRAAESAPGDAQAAASALQEGELAFVAAYRESYADRLRARRARSALIGGAVGTGVLVFAIFQFVDLGTSSANVIQDPGGSFDPAIVVPLFRWWH